MSSSTITEATLFLIRRILLQQFEEDEETASPWIGGGVGGPPPGAEPENDYDGSDSRSGFHDGSTRQQQQQQNENGNSNGEEAYEFVAFILWYIFLVLCCIVPTCCAYRRRRMVEHRLALQQASMNHHRNHQANNLFILSNLNQQNPYAQRRSSESLRQERTRTITEELKATTLTIQEEDIEHRSPADTDVESPTCIGASFSTQNSTDDDDDDNEDCMNRNNGGDGVRKDDDEAVGNKMMDTTPTALDESIFAEEAGRMIHLPGPSSYESSNPTTNAVVNRQNANRSVPGVCAICLCQYEIGDTISWSPFEDCQHAFHTDCVVSWLAKKDEPKCPICRQDFCNPLAGAAGGGGPEEFNLFHARNEENAFLESFSQALALSQFYRPSSDDNDADNNGNQNNNHHHPTTTSLELAIQNQFLTNRQNQHHQQQRHRPQEEHEEEGEINVETTSNNNHHNDGEDDIEMDRSGNSSVDA